MGEWFEWLKKFEFQSGFRLVRLGTDPAPIEPIIWSTQTRARSRAYGIWIGLLYPPVYEDIATLLLAITLLTSPHRIHRLSLSSLGAWCVDRRCRIFPAIAIGEVGRTLAEENRLREGESLTQS